MIRICLSAVLVALSPAWSAGAVGLHSAPAGAGHLAQPPALAAEPRRVHLLGTVEFYRVAVYVDAPISDRAHLVAPAVSKAVRIEVTYKEDLHRRITLDWRRELVPALDPAAMAHLRLTFAGLRLGDVVLIEYGPSTGTAIRLNKAVVTSGASHDLMLAFLDHWLGQRPVSEDMKRMLLGAS